MQLLTNIWFSAHQRTKHDEKYHNFSVVPNIITELDMEAECSGNQMEPIALPLLICLPLYVQQGADGKH